MEVIAPILFLGLPMLAGTIWGIVALARRLKDSQGSEQVFLVLGIVLLSLFAVAGTAAVGCVALMSGSHF